MASKRDSKNLDEFSEENAELSLEMLKNPDTFNETLDRLCEWVKQGHFDRRPNMLEVLQDRILEFKLSPVYENYDENQREQFNHKVNGKVLEAICFLIKSQERMLQAAIRPNNVDLLTEDQKKDLLHHVKDNMNDQKEFEIPLAMNRKKIRRQVDESRPTLEDEIGILQRKIQQLCEQLKKCEEKKHEIYRSEEDAQRILQKYREKLDKLEKTLASKIEMQSKVRQQN